MSRGWLTVAMDARWTILIVEDDILVRRVCKAALVAAGYVVLDAGSAQAALDVMSVNGKRLDLALIDVVLTGTQGPALGAELETLRADLRILYMSGYGQEVFQRGLKETDLFLQKPFTPESLCEAVQSALLGRKGQGGQ
jgi:two-component system, cell cycle sensor histidine kinase and response regulator CckA